MTIIDTEEHQCATCGHTLDAISSMEDGATPKENDLTLCFYCATAYKFDKDLNRHLLTDEDLQEIKEKDPGAFNMLLDAQEMLRDIKKLKDQGYDESIDN